ncbi:hypothetical protein ACFYNO_36130 [Kitasatospora sp. NPDC006697]|uniref:hypothetical protein n=1 Tax=Kitasatospora sp. NPDC006697 TaxID=3364020 RepID=UPI00368F03C9
MEYGLKFAVGAIPLMAILCAACSPDDSNGIDAVSDGEQSVYAAPFDQFITIDGEGTHENIPQEKWDLTGGSKVTIECRVTRKATRTYGEDPITGSAPSPQTFDVIFFKVSYGQGTGYVDSGEVRIISRSKKTNEVLSEDDVNAC